MSDPMPKIEAECSSTPKAVALFDEYNKCGERLKKLQAEGHTSEHSCAGYFFEFKNEVNKCVAPKLFAALK